MLAHNLSGISLEILAISKTGVPEGSGVVGSQTNVRSISSEELLRRAKSCQEYTNQRDRIFGKGVAREPSWDILLAALIAHLENRSISITDLTKNIPAPSATVMRHLTAR